MTTSVKISVPVPNHKKVKVSVMDIHHETGEETVFDEKILDHGEEVELYIYDIRQLRISETD